MKNNLIHQTLHDNNFKRLELVCEYCDYVASNELDKANHHWLDHNEKKPEFMKCEHCDKVFKNHLSIKAHYSKEHQEEFKFTCSQCPSRRINWSGHMEHHRVHHLENKLLQ